MSLTFTFTRTAEYAFHGAGASPNYYEILAEGASVSTGSDDGYLGHRGTDSTSGYYAMKYTFGGLDSTGTLYLADLRGATVESITLKVTGRTGDFSQFKKGRCVADGSDNLGADLYNSCTISGDATDSLTADFTSLGIPTTSSSYSVGGNRANRSSDAYRRLNTGSSYAAKLVVVVTELPSGGKLIINGAAKDARIKSIIIGGQAKTVSGTKILVNGAWK